MGKRADIESDVVGFLAALGTDEEPEEPEECEAVAEDQPGTATTS